MSPRTAKQPDCDVWKPATPLSFGMCHNCYNAWARAGRPDLRSWGPRRRKWLSEHSTRKCAVCDSLTTLTYLGMDMACYRAWATAGRPGFDGWALDRRAEPKPPRECLVCHRPTAQVYFGMDCSCYKAWCWLGVPTGTTGLRHDRRGSTDERDFGPKRRSARNEPPHKEGRPRRCETPRHRRPFLH